MRTRPPIHVRDRVTEKQKKWRRLSGIHSLTSRKQAKKGLGLLPHVYRGAEV